MPHLVLLHAIMLQEDNDTSVSSLQSVPLRQVLIDSNCIICMKVNKNFAIKLVAEETVTDIEARVVSCDGGGGALGHPKVYINLVRVNPLPLPLHYILVLINPVFLIGRRNVQRIFSRPLSSFIYRCCGFEHNNLLKLV